MDDDEESEEEAKEYMMRKADKKRKDDDDAKKHRKDDDEEDDRKDAEHSNPIVHGKAGEIKPDDDEDDRKDDDAKKDDDEEEEEAMRKDEEEAAMCDAQAKADSVYAAFGKSASRPLKGENLMAYRKRMARGLQGYSDAYKEVNLASIKDAKLLEIAEKQIFADALMAAKSPSMFAADQLVELHEKDRAGRTITKFKGAMSAWLDDFKVPSMRVKEFNLNNNKR